MRKAERGKHIKDMLTAENVNTIIQDATQVIGEVNDNIYCRHRSS